MQTHEVINIQHALHNCSIKNIRKFVHDLSDVELIKLIDSYLQSFLPYDPRKSPNLSNGIDLNANILSSMQSSFASKYYSHFHRNTKNKYSILNRLPHCLISQMASFMTFFERNFILKLVCFDFYQCCKENNLVSNYHCIIDKRLKKKIKAKEIDIQRLVYSKCLEIRDFYPSMQPLARDIMLPMMTQMCKDSKCQTVLSRNLQRLQVEDFGYWLHCVYQQCIKYSDKKKINTSLNCLLDSLSNVERLTWNGEISGWFSYDNINVSLKMLNRLILFLPQLESFTYRLRIFDSGPHEFVEQLCFILMGIQKSDENINYTAQNHTIQERVSMIELDDKTLCNYNLSTYCNQLKRIDLNLYQMTMWKENKHPIFLVQNCKLLETIKFILQLPNNKEEIDDATQLVSKLIDNLNNNVNVQNSFNLKIIDLRWLIKRNRNINDEHKNENSNDIKFGSDLPYLCFEYLFNLAKKNNVMELGVGLNDDIFEYYFDSKFESYFPAIMNKVQQRHGKSLTKLILNFHGTQDLERLTHIKIDTPPNVGQMDWNLSRSSTPTFLCMQKILVAPISTNILSLSLVSLGKNSLFWVIFCKLVCCLAINLNGLHFNCWNIIFVGIITCFGTGRFNTELLCLLRKALKCKKTKIQHLSLTTNQVPFIRDTIYDFNDAMSKEVTQLLTQITTNTSIKSLFIDPLWLKPQYNEFLRMWYSQPFGNCIIPKILDLNGRNDRNNPRRNKIMRCAHKSIYVATICRD